MSRLWLSLVMCLQAIPGLAAQTSGHQRVAVERDDRLELDFSLGLAVQEAGDLGMRLSPSLEAGLLLARRLRLELSLPVELILPLAHDSLPPARAAMGDPSISLSWSFRLRDWRLDAGLGYRHPLGVWNGYEAMMKSIVAGSGYPRVGGSLAAVRYLDPLALGLRLAAGSGLPRPEREGRSSRPLDLELALFATEAVNDRVALNLSLAGGLTAPVLLDGEPRSEWDWSLGADASLLISWETTTLRIGLGRDLVDPAAATPLSVSLGHTLRLGGKP